MVIGEGAVEIDWLRLRLGLIEIGGYDRARIQPRLIDESQQCSGARRMAAEEEHNDGGEQYEDFVIEVPALPDSVVEFLRKRHGRLITKGRAHLAFATSEGRDVTWSLLDFDCADGRCLTAIGAPSAGKALKLNDPLTTTFPSTIAIIHPKRGEKLTSPFSKLLEQIDQDLSSEPKTGNLDRLQQDIESLRGWALRKMSLSEYVVEHVHAS